MTNSARFIAWQALNNVVIEQKSLALFWENSLNQLPDACERALCHEIVFGSLRHYQSLKATLNQFLKKPINRKNQAVETLLVSALYQLKFLSSADYAVINESVNLCQQTIQQTKQQNYSWAKGLVNATLRNYIKADKPYKSVSNLPDWLSHKLNSAYPEHMELLATAMQTPTKVMLRVHQGERQAHINTLNTEGFACQAHPDAKEAIILTESANIFELPQFQAGELTVQDANAQLAANLLQIKAGQAILDACAAPGGKTAHLFAKSQALEPAPQIIALDDNPKRVAKMQQTLSRLHCEVNIETADLVEYSQTTDNHFERILLDVPCSATGVMAKHPDIAFVRNEQTVNELVTTQQALLEAAWQRLKPNGVLLYATCSILPEENSEQIKHFLASHTDASLDKLAHNRALATDNGMLQFLPSPLGDGFFYARLKKASI